MKKTDNSIPTNQRVLVGRQEAADLLSLSLASLEHLLKAGRIPSIRLGGRRLIRVSDLVAFSQSDHLETIRPTESKTK